MQWIVGLLLIGAAVLKAVELYQHPATVLVNNSVNFLTPLLIGCEIGLGLAAVSGLYWRQLRLLAIVLFIGFGCYSLLLALEGAASCGCFGPLEINPWWTFLLDMTVLTGLGLEWYAQRAATNINRTAQQHRVRLATVVVISLAVSVSLAWHVLPRSDASQNGFQIAGNLVVLEPETWVGQNFPLLDHIDLDVSLGKWVLLLHRHDCADCQAAVPKYVQLALRQNDTKIGLIEVPPYDSFHQNSLAGCHVGRLSADRDWFVQTPVEIQLTDGVVTNASGDLPSLPDTTLHDAK